MGKKLKFAVIALLGFSTACSASKKNQKSNEPDPTTEAQPTEMVPIESPRIRVMYGVRPPYPITAIEDVQAPEEKQPNDSEQTDQQEQTSENPEKTE